MYNQKLKSNLIDESDIARHSSTISFVPSIHRKKGKNHVVEKGRVVSNEYYLHKMKREKIILDTKAKTTLEIVNPESRNISTPKAGSPVNMLEKLGKRISSIGFFSKSGTKVETKLEHYIPKRVVSMPAWDNLVMDNSVLEMYPDHKYPQMKVEKSNSQLPPIPLPSEYKDGQLEYELPNDSSRIYSKDNQIFVNLSDASAESLVSKLITSYSHMELSDLEDDSNNSNLSTISASNQNYKVYIFDQQYPKLTNANTVFEFNSPASNNSTYASTKDSDDVFSNAQTAATVSSIESMHLQSPTKPVNQFQLRDYNGSQNFEIFDNSIPPTTPKHAILPTRTFSSPATQYYDCKSSFSSSPMSSIETAKFTRQSFSSRKPKSYGPKIQPAEIHKEERSISLQYLKKAGIDPFMLTGYQNATQLKVVN